MPTSIKKKLICEDENLTTAIYPYTATECVFDGNGNSLDDLLTVDDAFSTTSTKPVQNRLIKSALDNRALSSHTHGNITNVGDITTSVAIASGDRLVINDESASRINNSTITFDGSTTTQFLSRKGTWQSLVIPKVNVSNVLFTKNGSGAWSYTATAECYVYFSGYTVKIDNVNISTQASGYTQTSGIYLRSGQTISGADNGSAWSAYVKAFGLTW